MTNVQEQRTRDDAEHRMLDMTTDELFDVLPDEDKQQIDADWAESLDEDDVYQMAHLLADYNDAALGDLKLRLSKSRDAYREHRIEERRRFGQMVEDIVNSWMGR